MKKCFLYGLLMLMTLPAYSAEYNEVTDGLNMSMCLGVQEYSSAQSGSPALEQLEVINDLPFPTQVIYLTTDGWRKINLGIEALKVIDVTAESVVAVVDPSLRMCLGAHALRDGSSSALVASRSFQFFEGERLLAKHAKSKIECPVGINNFDIGGLTRGTVESGLIEHCLATLPDGASLPVNAVVTIAKGGMTGIANFRRFVDAASRCELMEESLSAELKSGLNDASVSVGVVFFRMEMLRKAGQKFITKGVDEEFDVYTEAWINLARDYPRLVKKFDPIPQKKDWAGPCMCGILGGC